MSHSTIFKIIKIELNYIIMENLKLIITALDKAIANKIYNDLEIFALKTAIGELDKELQPKDKEDGNTGNI